MVSSYLVGSCNLISSGSRKSFSSLIIVSLICNINMRLIISVQPTFIHFLEKQNTEGSDKLLKKYLESTVWLNQSIQQE